MNFDQFLSDGDQIGAGYILADGPRADLKWIGDGYAMEHTGSGSRTKIISFLGPDQFVLPVLPGSAISTLCDCYVLSISRKHFFEMLRKFPESRDLYRIFKQKHLERIAQYHHDLKHKTPAERYIDLLEQQPWVPGKAEPGKIASYLNISLTQYQQLIQIN